MPKIRSNRAKLTIKPYKPPRIQYLEDYTPRWLRSHVITVYEDEIKDYDFTDWFKGGVYGTTYKVKSAKDTSGNPVDDTDLTELKISIPKKSTPLVRFDASNVTLTGNSSVRYVYYKLTFIQPTGGDEKGQSHISTWVPLQIKKRT